MKKRLVAVNIYLVFALMLPNLALAAQGGKYPHAKFAVYDLSSTHTTELINNPTLQQQVIKWQADRVDFIVGGENPHAYDSNLPWVQYRTQLGTYWPNSGNVYATTQPLFPYKDWAGTQGYDFENFFLHMKIDYSSKHPWSEANFNNVAKFDVYENAHGIIVDNGGTLTDKTMEGWDTNAGDVSFSSNLYVGYEYPFAEINFSTNRFAVGLLGEFQYWNGTTWNTLSNTDGTTNFTQNGKVSFNPPSDWKKTVVMGSRNKYFVRYHINSATTTPIFNNIKGDDWMAGALCRGWAKDDPNIINKGLGELEFNPNPPAGSSAKFRIQSRLTGYWSANYVFQNPAYIVDGHRPWADYEAQVLNDLMQTTSLNGFYYDSFGGSIDVGINAPYALLSNTDLSEYTAGDLNSEALPNFLYLKDQLKTLNPQALIGGNTYIRTFALAGDYSLNEYAASTTAGGAMPIMSVSGDNHSSYDDYLPASNPTGKKYIVQHTDLFDARANAFFDRGNRGPLVALSSNYIAMNDNSYFHYYTTGGAWYTETDDVFVYDQNTTTSTQDIPVDTTAAVKTIKGVDFSAFPASGLDAAYGQGARPVKIGDNLINFTKVDNQTLTTTSAINNAIPAGSVIKFVNPNRIHQSDCKSSDCVPNSDNVYRWAKFFPAMFYDIGQIDAGGWNGGARGVWNTSFNVYRRDFTNAIVLNRPAAYNTTKTGFDTYSTPIELGGTYYPLRADGKFDAPITQISLRTGEGAILVKEAVVNDNEAPTVPTSLSSSNTSDTQTTISWTASTDNVSSPTYKIFRDAVQIGTSNTNSYTDKTVSPQTTYSYTVKATDGKNESAASAPLSVTTTATTKYSLSHVITLITNWLKSGTVSDINSDGKVNSKDLGIMMSKWE